MRGDIVTWMGLTRHRLRDVRGVWGVLTNTHGYAGVFHIIIRAIVDWFRAIVAILILRMKIML